MCTHPALAAGSAAQDKDKSLLACAGSSHRVRRLCVCMCGMWHVHVGSVCGRVPWGRSGVSMDAAWDAAEVRRERTGCHSSALCTRTLHSHTVWVVEAVHPHPRMAHVHVDRSRSLARLVLWAAVLCVCSVLSGVSEASAVAPPVGRVSVRAVHKTHRTITRILARLGLAHCCTLALHATRRTQTRCVSRVTSVVAVSASGCDRI